MRAIEIASFCRQLNQLLQQGVGLRTALLLVRDSRTGLIEEAITAIVNELDRGMPLGEAMEQREFPPLFVSFVKAGEHHGSLVRALQKGEWYYRRKHDIRQTLLKGLMYPLFVLLLMAMSFVLLQTTVLPRFATLYETIGLDLPWYTAWLLRANQAGVYLAIAAFILFVLLTTFYKKGVIRALMRIGLAIPMVREVVQLRVTSVFCWQLGLLLQAGTPLLKAFETVLAGWPWNGSRRAILRVQDRLKRGFSLQDSFVPEADKFFHPFLPRQLAIGESSGTVAETLLYSGEMADEQLEERIQWVLRVWEPLLILVIGIALGLMVLALFVPILSLVEGL